MFVSSLLSIWLYSVIQAGFTAHCQHTNLSHPTYFYTQGFRVWIQFYSQSQGVLQVLHQKVSATGMKLGKCKPSTPFCLYWMIHQVVRSNTERKDPILYSIKFSSFWVQWCAGTAKATPTKASGEFLFAFVCGCLKKKYFDDDFVNWNKISWGRRICVNLKPGVCNIILFLLLSKRSWQLPEKGNFREVTFYLKRKS